MEYVAVARGAKDGRTHRSVPTGCINVSLIYLWPFMPMEGHTCICCVTVWDAIAIARA